MQKLENNDNAVAVDVKTTDVTVIKFSLKQTLLVMRRVISEVHLLDAGLDLHKSEDIVEIFHLFALIACHNKHENENVEYVIVSIATLQA